jgi:hypothetical protein
MCLRVMSLGGGEAGDEQDQIVFGQRDRARVYR